MILRIVMVECDLHRSAVNLYDMLQVIKEELFYEQFY